MAALKVVSEYGVSCRLKWPNDLLVEGKKLGGILVEGVFEGDELRGSVVGIGINVLLDPCELDEPLGSRTTSLQVCGSAPVDLEDLALRLARAVVEETGSIASGRLDGVLADWKRASATFGRRVEFERAGEKLTGVAVNLDPNGALIVQQNGGERVIVQTGEVVFIDD